MYIAYHDKNNKLHMIHDCEEQYFGSWGTNHQCSILIKGDKVIEEYCDWTPEEPSDDTWTSDRQVLGIVDFTGPHLDELVSQHKEWFRTFVEQTNE